MSFRTKDINSLVHCQHNVTHMWTKVNVDGGHVRFSWSGILKKKTKLSKIKTMHIHYSSIFQVIFGYYQNLSHELVHFQF